MLAKNIFRLHIVANSNSIEDQIIKLKVNEKISNYIKQLTKNCKNKNDLKNAIYSNTKSILNMSNQELKDNNIKYASNIEIGNIKYNKKENIDYTMPIGNYDSIKIILGNGEGKNIWSLLFPDSNNIKNLDALENILPGISNLYNTNNYDNNDSVEYSFKIVEIINNVLKHY